MPISVNGANGITFADGSIQNTGAAGFGFKNRIINGAMVIDQRNAGASVTINSNQYTIDRYQAIQTQTGKYSVQQSTTVPTGFKNSMLITSASAYSILVTDTFYFRQSIEGYNVADLAFGTASAATVTLSFWVRSSLTGTFGGALKNDGGNRSYPFSYTIIAANTWEQKSITIAGDQSGTWDTGTARGLQVIFGLGVGSNFSTTAGAWAAGDYSAPTGAVSLVGTSGATFYITGVQLEKGSTATAFDYRDFGRELQMCQRYYERSYDIGTTTGTFGNGWSGFTTGTNANGEATPNIIFKVTKRASPTVVGYNAVSGASNAVYRVSDAASIGINYFNYIGTNQVGLCNLLSGSSNSYYVSWTASAEL
jgi:hypothetical protein